jgi:hypothetical protein
MPPYFKRSRKLKNVRSCSYPSAQVFTNTLYCTTGLFGSPVPSELPPWRTGRLLPEFSGNVYCLSDWGLTHCLMLHARGTVHQAAEGTPVKYSILICRNTTLDLQSDVVRAPSRSFWDRRSKLNSPSVQPRQLIHFDNTLFLWLLADNSVLRVSDVEGHPVPCLCGISRDARHALTDIERPRA